MLQLAGFIHYCKKCEGSRQNIMKINFFAGKLFTSNENVPSLNLKLLCEKLRTQSSKKQKDSITKEEGTEQCKGCKQNSLNCVCLTSQHRGAASVVLASSETSSQMKTHLSVDGVPSKEIAHSYPDLLYDLLYKLLDPNPDRRISADTAISHPFIVHYSKRNE